MRFVVIGIYAFALVWLFLSICNFYANYRYLRDMENEITLIRARIDVWKTEMRILREVCDENRVNPDRHNRKKGSFKKD